MKDVIFLWATFGIIISVVFLYFAGRVPLLAHPQERSFLATMTTVLTLTAVCAILVLPALDIALVSSTNIPLLGVRKEKATDAKVDAIILWTKIAYIGFYALMAILLLILTPFSWVYFEEWDEDSSNMSRAATATKYTTILLATLAFLMALGLFIPTATRLPDNIRGIDLDYLKQLLASSRPTKSLLFVLGILVCVGTLTSIYYTSTGLATFPLTLLKTKSSKDLDAEEGDNAVDLDINRQEQRQIELRYEGTRNTMSPRDRKALESLQRRERVLIRSQRLRNEGRLRLWERLSRPVHLFFGLLFLMLSLLIIATLAIALVRRLLSDDSCGARCDFLRALPSSILLNPVNLALTSLPYYVSFILHVLLCVFLLLATLHGIQSLGIRFLWLSMFKLSPRASVPQALLSLSAVSVSAALGIQYTSLTFLVPGYVQYGTQTFCNATLSACATDNTLVIPCTLLTDEPNSGCTRSVVSRIGASLTFTFPIISALLSFAQFGILLVFLTSLIVGVFKKNLGQHMTGIDDDDDDEEEDGTVNERTRLT